MAEDKNKKDSFTFSDKIKDTKPSPVPFSKRFSASKVGSDGKPKKTFFERTKRDAPFFIAALIVLLLLPFFIKFTGTGADEGDIIVRNPFDAVSDGGPAYDQCLDENGQLIDGCVAGASGRDSIDMLRDAIAQGEPVPAEASVYTPTSPISSPESRSAYSDLRQSAPASMGRAMAARQPTNIGSLRSGEAARAGGRVNPGYGPVSASAAQTGPTGPARASKPITLQPLTGASRLGRSVTGEAALAEAQRSLGAMGKRDAMQALMDAQLGNPAIGRGGGLGTGRVGGGGGGGGGLNNKWSYQGEKPWWWDMMKERAQAKWMFWFHLWSDALKKLTETFGMGMACCLIAGKDDCSVDKFWGSAATESSDGNCNGIDQKDWKDKQGTRFPTSATECCSTFYKQDSQKDMYTKCTTNADGTFFSKAHGAAPAVGPWQQRTGCWGYHGKGKGLTLSCQTKPEIATDATPGKGNADWYLYTFVVTSGIDSLGNPICGWNSPNRAKTPAGTGLNSTKKDQKFVDMNNDVRATANQNKNASKRKNPNATETLQMQMGSGVTAPNSPERSFQGGQQQLSGGETYIPNATAGVEFKDAKNNISNENIEDCVIFVKGGKGDDGQDQGGMFRENQLRQDLVDCVFPELYNCNGEHKCPNGYGGYMVNEDGTRHNPSEPIGSCSKYLDRIFVKYVQAVSMQEPLAVNWADKRGLSDDPKKSSYSPKLPLKLADFTSFYLTRQGNDYNKDPREVDRMNNQSRSAIFTSNKCEVARSLSAFNLSDYCKDDDDKIYKLMGDVKGEEVNVKAAAYNQALGSSGGQPEPCPGTMIYYAIDSGVMSGELAGAQPGTGSAPIAANGSAVNANTPNGSGSAENTNAPGVNPAVNQQGNNAANNNNSSGISPAVAADIAALNPIMVQAILRGQLSEKDAQTEANVSAEAYKFIQDKLASVKSASWDNGMGTAIDNLQAECKNIVAQPQSQRPSAQQANQAEAQNNGQQGAQQTNANSAEDNVAAWAHAFDANAHITLKKPYYALQIDQKTKKVTKVLCEFDNPPSSVAGCCMLKGKPVFRVRGEITGGWDKPDFYSLEDISDDDKKCACGGFTRLPVCDPVPVQPVVENFQASVGSVFELGSAILSESGKKELDAYAERIKNGFNKLGPTARDADGNYHFYIRTYGYTDGVNVSKIGFKVGPDINHATRAPGANLALSETRAEVVKKHLNLAIGKDRFILLNEGTSMGFGIHPKCRTLPPECQKAYEAREKASGNPEILRSAGFGSDVIIPSYPALQANSITSLQYNADRNQPGGVCKAVQDCRRVDVEFYYKDSAQSAPAMLPCDNNTCKIIDKLVK
ncbi:MAG: hypothetical protein LBI01_00615 [Elusimicrobium sp.]|jgi:hypothetical protein|nr:hypothetical protein [Elusimicrobium sp.]